MSTAPIVRNHVRIEEARNLLLARMGVLLRRACRGLSAGLTRSRKQAFRRTPAATSGLISALMGRALSSKRAHGRMLSVEERLTLGPKQHMYLVRCGERRLLVASAGEGALQWMAMPGSMDSNERELQRVTATDAIVAEDSGVKANSRRRSAAKRAETKGTKRCAAKGSDGEGAR